MKLDELKIDLDFEHVIPAISQDEYNTLEQNILDDGKVNEPLVVWNSFIVDGHSRYKILLKHPEIPFTTVERDFQNKFFAIMWICRNQIGRRNLKPQNMKYLIGKLYESERLARGEHRNHEKSGENQMGQNDPFDHGTRTELAKDTGKSESYIKRAFEVAQGVDCAEEVCPGFVREYRDGKIKASDKEIAEVRRASPEDRPELVAELKKPPGERRKIALPVLKEKIMPERVYISPEELSDSELQPQPVISDSLPTVDSPGLSDILKEAGVKGISNIPSELPDRDDTNPADTDKPIEESILHSMHLAVVHLMESFNNYFYRFPSLLEDPKYRDRSVAVVKEFETYISQIEKGVQENETAEP